MMNYTTKEYNRKNTYKNNVVCNTLRSHEQLGYQNKAMIFNLKSHKN